MCLRHHRKDNGERKDKGLGVEFKVQRIGNGCVIQHDTPVFTLIKLSVTIY